MSVGRPPPFGSSFQLIDGRWVRGIADGVNRSFQNSITAHSGGTKAAAFQLPANVSQFEIDTVAAGNDSVLLPAAKAGQTVMVFNAAASNTLNIYGKGADTINLVATTTAYALTTGQAAIFFCSKDGLWASVKTA